VDVGKWFKDLLAKEGVKETLHLVVPIAFGLSAAAVGSFSFGEILELSLLVTVPLFVFVGLILSTAAAVAYRRFFTRRPHYPAVPQDFRVLKSTIRYEFRTPYRMVYARKWRLRALKDGHDRLTDKYSWTGFGEIRMSAPLDGQRVSTLDRQGVWNRYDVHFGRTLSKREEIEVEVVWELEDTLETSVDFFSKTIERPTDELEMVFRTYPGSPVQAVSLQQCRTLELDVPHWSDQRTIDEDRFVRWLVKRPKFGQLYRVSWIDKSRDEEPASQ